LGLLIIINILPSLIAFNQTPIPTNPEIPVPTGLEIPTPNVSEIPSPTGLEILTSMLVSPSYFGIIKKKALQKVIELLLINISLY
jgi:hypothetical protein